MKAFSIGNPEPASIEYSSYSSFRTLSSHCAICSTVIIGDDHSP